MTALFFIVLMVIMALDIDMADNLFAALLALVICFIFDNVLISNIARVRGAIEMVARKIDDA